MYSLCYTLFFAFLYQPFKKLFLAHGPGPCWNGPSGPTANKPWSHLSLSQGLRQESGSVSAISASISLA